MRKLAALETRARLWQDAELVLRVCTGRGESQRSLAALTGITYAYISEMERGLKVPSLTTIIRLALALECEVIDLVDVFTGRDLRKLIPKRK